MLAFLIDHQNFFLLITFILGACIGSFLNVVIYRLPIIIERDWKNECETLLDINIENTETASISLYFPGSFCTNCKVKIPFYRNIPIVSYCLQKGRCHQCQKNISMQYPMIELCTAFATLYAASYFGPTITMLASACFLWILIALMAIDFKHYILPDQLNLGLLWLGLLSNVYELFVPLPDAVLGAIIGYCSLWLFVKLFWLVTKKEGMGHGDFKLFAALGAWMGWHQLLFIMIAGSLLGAIVGIALILFKNRDKSVPLPFGPFLGTAGSIAFFWGDSIMQQYFQMTLVHY